MSKVARAWKWGAYSLVMMTMTASLMPAPANPRLRVAFFGDSVTRGDGASSFEHGYRSIINERLHEAGFSPSDRTVLSAFGGLFGDIANAPSVTAQPADLIIVEVGAHSVVENPDLPAASFRRGYALMLDCLASTGATVVVSTPPSLAWDPASPRYARAQLVSEIIEGEAEKRGVAVADLWNATKSRPELVSADGMHPGDQGHRLIADLFWQRIKPQLHQVRAGTASVCDYNGDAEASTAGGVRDAH